MGMVEVSKALMKVLPEAGSWLDLSSGWLWVQADGQGQRQGPGQGQGQAQD